MAKKQYLKSLYINEYKFSNGGTVLNLSCKLENLIKELTELQTPQGYVNFHIAELREPKVFPNGKSTTHCSYVTFKDEDSKPAVSSGDPFADI